VIRPADANETVEAWRVALEDVSGPALLVLTRQDLPVLDGTREGLARGAYVLADGDAPDAVLVATFFHADRIGGEAHTSTWTS